MPATSQCLIQLNQRQQLVEPGLDKRHFWPEGIGLDGQGLQITGGAAVVSQVGKVRSVRGGLGEQCLLGAQFPRLALGDQRFRDAAEGALNGLLVEKQRGLLLRSAAPVAYALLRGLDSLSTQCIYVNILCINIVDGPKRHRSLGNETCC